MNGVWSAFQLFVRSDVPSDVWSVDLLIAQSIGCLVTLLFGSSVDWLTFFLNLCGGILGTAATTGLLYQPRMIGDGDCGEIGGMKIGRGNQSTRRKPAPAPLSPPQIPHD
jgi:hypothetical protein